MKALVEGLPPDQQEIMKALVKGISPEKLQQILAILNTD